MSGDEIIRGAFAVAMVNKDNEARVDLQASGRSVKRSSGAITSAEEVHLRRLWWFDVEGRSSRCCGFGWVRLGVAVEKLSQFFEVFTKRFEHAALVQGCGGMEQGEEDKFPPSVPATFAWLSIPYFISNGSLVDSRLRVFHEQEDNRAAFRAPLDSSSAFVGW
jgi:hypothetical protein